jgi:hypothetical protein
LFEVGWSLTSHRIILRRSQKWGEVSGRMVLYCRSKFGTFQFLVQALNSSHMTVEAKPVMPILNHFPVELNVSRTLYYIVCIYNRSERLRLSCVVYEFFAFCILYVKPTGVMFVNI